MSEGIVYILTNEAMPHLVKIGKTTDSIDKRMKEFYTTSIPVPFECFHASKVKDMEFVEKQLHDAFKDSRVHPKREFFKVSPERVRSALLMVKGEDVTPGNGVLEDADDQMALNKARTWRVPFNFKMVGIPIGATLQFLKDAKFTCTVANNKKVNFRNEEISLSRAAHTVLGEIMTGRTTKSWPRGPTYWMYEGETLDERQRRME